MNQSNPQPKGKGGDSRGSEVVNGVRRSGFTWIVHLKPESIFRLAYKVRGATPILPGFSVCHVGQFQLTVGLSVVTDNTL